MTKSEAADAQSVISDAVRFAFPTFAEGEFYKYAKAALADRAALIEAGKRILSAQRPGYNKYSDDQSAEIEYYMARIHMGALLRHLGEID